MSKNTHHEELLLRALPLLECLHVDTGEGLDKRFSLINDIKESLSMAREHTITHQGKTASMFIDEDIDQSYKTFFDEYSEGIEKIVNMPMKWNRNKPGCGHEECGYTCDHELEQVIQRTKCSDKSCMSCESKSYE